MRGQSFRLKTPTLGIFNDKDTTVVPADAVITVVSDPDSTNHVYALYEGRKILIFVRDIQERGTPMASEPTRATRQ